MTEKAESRGELYNEGSLAGHEEESVNRERAAKMWRRALGLRSHSPEGLRHIASGSNESVGRDLDLDDTRGE